jgi:transcriptional regulator with XRE-family HTH domain
MSRKSNTDVNPELFKQRLVELRKNKHNLMKKKLSQAELAERLGISDKTVLRYENGRTIPTMNMIWEMAKILNTNEGYLTGRINYPYPCENWYEHLLSEITAKAEEETLEFMKIKKNLADHFKNRITNFLSFFSYDVWFPTIEDVQSEWKGLPIEDTMMISDYGTPEQMIEIYPESDPDSYTELKVSDILGIISDVHDYIEFRLFQLKLGEKLKEKINSEADLMEETDDAEEE